MHATLEAESLALVGRPAPLFSPCVDQELEFPLEADGRAYRPDSRRHAISRDLPSSRAAARDHRGRQLAEPVALISA